MIHHRSPPGCEHSAPCVTIGIAVLKCSMLNHGLSAGIHKIHCPGAAPLLRLQSMSDGHCGAAATPGARCSSMWVMCKGLYTPACMQGPQLHRGGRGRGQQPQRGQRGGPGAGRAQELSHRPRRPAGGPRHGVTHPVLEPNGGACTSPEPSSSETCRLTMHSVAWGKSTSCPASRERHDTGGWHVVQGQTVAGSRAC